MGQWLKKRRDKTQADNTLIYPRDDDRPKKHLSKKERRKTRNLSK